MESNTQKGIYLFFIFFKGMMGAFTSGMAAIPTIERGIVDKKGWLTHKEFWTYPVLGQSLPGVISLHNAMLLGNRIAGPFGSFMATMGVIVPTFLCMFLIAAVFQVYVDNPYVQGIIKGIRTVSVALILGNGIRLFKNTPRDAFSLIIVAVSVIVPLFFGFSAFWTIILSGTAGIILAYLDPKALNKKPASGIEEE